MLNFFVQYYFQACWLEIPEMRPNIKKIKEVVNATLKTTQEIIPFYPIKLIVKIKLLFALQKFFF